MAVTNLRVVCKIITCASAFSYILLKKNQVFCAFSEMAIIILLSFFLEIIKSCCRSGYSALQATRKMPLWALAIALSTGKNTRLFGVLGLERDTIFHLLVTACREQGSHCRDERLAGVASQWQGAPSYSSRKSWERTARELTTLILWLINSPCELTEVTFEPTSNAHARVDYNTL